MGEIPKGSSPYFCLGEKVIPLTTWQVRFIESIAPLVQKYAAQYGYKFPSAIIAQACVESAYGQSVLSSKYNNYFGMKCGTKWTGRSVNMATKEEYSDGVLTDISANFRAYDTTEDGIRGYFEFIQLPRYYNLKTVASSLAYLQTIKADGYATSSTYVETCYRVVEEFGLLKYDPSATGIDQRVLNAMTWMIGIAQDNSHGYDQQNRWGKDYDCSSLIISAFQNAGIPVKTMGATYTGNMYSAFKKCGFFDVTKYVNLATASGMQEGDVLLNKKHHTAMYIGNGQICQASINEFGKTVGGRTGDQTGKEIWIRSYYNYPWDCVLRYGQNATTEQKKGKPSKVIKFVGEVTASVLNVRTWAGTEYPQIKTHPFIYYGGRVYVCDTLKAEDGSDWYYILIPNGNVYGFVAAEYIRRIA